VKGEVKMKKRLVGKVVSDKMDKTIVVAVENTIRDRRFGKTITRTSKYKVHDEKNECHEGDIVRIEETRPISKEKSWKLVEILKRNILTSEEEEVSKGEGVPE